jgi:hypothetical protein
MVLILTTTKLVSYFDAKTETIDSSYVLAIFTLAVIYNDNN